MRAVYLVAWLTIVVQTHGAGAGEPYRRPVVAVFPVQDNGVGLRPQELDALTDYLGTRLGETGDFRVIPRDEIRARLVEQKKESYRSCYQRSCQIEIGRELAAGMSVSAKIARLGKSCIVTAGLYDLGKAATRTSGTARSGCAPDALLGAIDEVVAKLAGTTPTRPEAAPAAAPLVVRVETRPPGAALLLDGEQKGTTPASIRLQPGSMHELTLRKDGYKRITRRLDAASPSLQVFSLEKTEASLRQAEIGRTEWIGVDLQLGLAGSHVVLGGRYRLFVLKWQHVFWNILEIVVTLPSLGGETEMSGMVGTRIGYPLYLGEKGRHQLRFGLGAGFCFVDESGSTGDTQDDANREKGLCLSPGITYIYQTGGWFHFGAGITSNLPVLMSGEEGLVPFSLSFFVPLGWTGSAD